MTRLARTLAVDGTLLGLEVLALLGTVAWCRAVGHEDRWSKGSTTMTLACDRCGRAKNTIPRR